MEFGTCNIVEQRRLLQACQNAQTRQGLRCLHMESMDVDEDSDKDLDLYNISDCAS